MQNVNIRLLTRAMMLGGRYFSIVCRNTATCSFFPRIVCPNRSYRCETFSVMHAVQVKMYRYDIVTLVKDSGLSPTGIAAIR